MFTQKNLVTSATLVVSLLLSGHVLASDKSSFFDALVRYQDETSGTSVSSIVDTNGDGFFGTVSTFKGRSSRGPVTITSFSEFNPLAAGPTQECPAPRVEFPMVESTLVYRFVGGDLLFLRVTEAVFCMDPFTGLYTFTNSSTILGGTGRYAGATGTIDAEGSGGSLSFHPSGLLHFGWTTMKNSGTIYRDTGIRAEP